METNPHSAVIAGPDMLMKKRPKEPFIPEEKHDTVRREIVALLQCDELSAREISAEIGISEKEVPGHLEHIRMMLHGSGSGVRITPASCRKCGFVFKKRERFTRPGKCPVCRGEQIEEPRFSIG